jgi:hypothetical protein
MSRSMLVAWLMLLASTAAAQTVPADVPAAIVNTQFSCGIGTVDTNNDPTQVPAASVALFRSDATGFIPLCVDMQGVFKVRAGFVIPYVAGVVPIMKATSFSATNCTGDRSDNSANSCLVSHVFSAPMLIDPNTVPLAPPPVTAVPPAAPVALTSPGSIAAAVEEFLR